MEKFVTKMNLENLPGLEEDAVEIDNDLRSKGSYILNVIFQEKPANWLCSIDSLSLPGCAVTTLDHGIASE